MSSIGASGKRLLFLLAAAVVVTVAIAGTLQYGFNVDIAGIFRKPSTQEPPTVEPTAQWLWQTGGTIDLDTIFLWTHDDSEQTSNIPTAICWSGDKATLKSSYDSTNKQFLARLDISDQGVLWISADIGTGTTFYVDKASTLSKNSRLTECVAYDVDNDKILEYMFKYDARHLPALTAGEAQKNDKINIYLTKYDSGPTLTSSSNVTGVSTTAYNDYYTELYISGWTGEGYAIKLNRLQITLPDAANATYGEDGYLKLLGVDVTYSGALGKVSYSGTKITWNYASTRWEIDLGVTDLNNEVYGQMVYYSRGAGTTFAKVLVHYQAKFPSSSKTILPTVKFYYIDPAGTVTSFTQITSVAS